MRELVLMAEARATNEWAHTSAVLAMLANAHRDPKKTRVFTPNDFNPLEARKRKRLPGRSKDLSILKTVFVDQARPGASNRKEKRE